MLDTPWCSQGSETPLSSKTAIIPHDSPHGTIQTLLPLSPKNILKTQPSVC